ncbi:MAG: [cytidine(C)-cytidine(C)-adenosine (A)]-adding enzyme [Myxococcales bacterium]|nr:[cytidine(C)-cytidine(C)-adenosine (A)]-adding enzyme [Myxococcales bacterium]
MSAGPDTVEVALEPPPAWALSVAEGLRGAGFEAYFVGGAVRDRLLGRPVSDWDIATDAEPEAVMGCFARAIPTGLQHGTVTVVVAHQPVEVTTYRVERGYSDGRRPDEVAFTRELRDDLGRRDFTINAMAWDAVAGVLVDPYDGRGDLGRRLLRAVGAAEERFSEDGLRALRAVRFACVLELALDPATRAAIPATMATFRKVSAERIRVELGKILGARRVAWGVEALWETGLLGEFLPEALPGLGRAVAALGEPPSGEVARLAVLLHGGGSDGDGPLRRLRYGNEERGRLVALLRQRGLDPAVARSDAAVRALVAQVGLSVVDEVIAYRMALARVDAPEEYAAWQALAARIDAIGARSAPQSARELSLDGKAVMAALGIAPSRRVGRILDALLMRVWADPSLDTPERLRALLPVVAAEVGEGA